MNQIQSKLLKYLFETGAKEFDGELLPSKNFALSKISKDWNISFEELYKTAQNLDSQGLLELKNVKGEIGNTDIIAAGQVIITTAGIEYMKSG